MDLGAFLIAIAALFAARGSIGRRLAGAKAALNNAMHGSFPAFMRHFVSKAVLLVAVLSIVLTGAELGWALVLKSVDSLGNVASSLPSWIPVMTGIGLGLGILIAIGCGIGTYLARRRAKATLAKWLLRFVYFGIGLAALSGAGLVINWVLSMGSIMAQAVLFILIQTGFALYAYVAGKMEFETLRNADGDLIPYQNMRSVSEKWVGYALWAYNALTKKDPRDFLRNRGVRFYNDPANPAPVAGWDYQPVYRNAGSTAPVAIILWIVVACGWLVGQGAWIHFFHAFDIPSVTRFGISHFNERVAHGFAFLSAGSGVILLAVVGQILGFMFKKLIASFEKL
ncbi:hypothetical protein KKG46_06010, partial [Patescibacteria group bacterium]|nr:hypothetical protein [Patescibacteria group bacterium]